MALGVSKLSSKFGMLVSLMGDSGGVAYNGDIQLMSERSTWMYSTDCSYMSDTDSNIYYRICVELTKIDFLL